MAKRHKVVLVATICVLVVYPAAFLTVAKPVYGITTVTSAYGRQQVPAPTRVYVSRNVIVNRFAGVVFWPMVALVSLFDPLVYVWDASASQLE